MIQHLCSAGFDYDAEDAAALAAAIESAKRELGKALQARGVLTEITYPLAWMGMNPLYAGELAATALNLTQRQLADWKDRDIKLWTANYIRRFKAPIALVAD